MKKKILMAFGYILIVVLAITGTIAYLQDTDEDVNVMTLGSVQIEQIEQEWDAGGKLVPFTQAKSLMPAYTTDPNGSISWAANTQWPVDNEAWKVVEDNDHLNNVTLNLESDADYLHLFRNGSIVVNTTAAAGSVTDSMVKTYPGAGTNTINYID